MMKCRSTGGSLQDWVGGQDFVRGRRMPRSRGFEQNIIVSGVLVSSKVTILLGVLEKLARGPGFGECRIGPADPSTGFP
jgi:hypothetical protein